VQTYGFCFWSIYHLTRKSSEWRGVFPKRTNHRVYLSWSVWVEWNRFAGHYSQLNGASGFAHRNICDIFKPEMKKWRVRIQIRMTNDEIVTMSTNTIHNNNGAFQNTKTRIGFYSRQCLHDMKLVSFFAQ